VGAAVARRENGEKISEKPKRSKGPSPFQASFFKNLGKKSSRTINYFYKLLELG
jgi:hypothetical protein